MRIWLPLLLALLSGALVLAGLRSRSDSYEARASLYVFGNPSSEEAISAIGVQVFNTDSRDYVVSLLGSEGMAREVVKTLKLEQSSDFWRHSGSKRHNAEVANVLLRQLVKVENTPRSPITIRAITKVPKLSKEITETYLNLLKTRLKAGVKRNEDFWDRHLREHRQRIKALEDQLQKFQSKHPIVMQQDKHAEGEFGFYIKLSEELAIAQTNLEAVKQKLDAPAKPEEILQLKAEKAGLEGRVDNLLKLVDSKSEMLKDLPTATVEHDRIERSLSNEQKALETMTASYQRSSLRGEIIPYEIVDEPVEPQEPVDRPLSKDALAAAACGLVVGWITLQLVPVKKVEP